MTDGKLPLLRGRIESSEVFAPVTGPRGQEASLPPRDPNAHRAALIAQLDALRQAVAARDPDARHPDANRELVVVKPAKGQALPLGSLRDGEKVRVVGEDPDTGAVLLDAASAELKGLRRKIADYADPTKVSAKSGAPKNDKLIAPLEHVALATLEDIASPRALEALTKRPQWLVLSCSGGTYDPDVSAASRRKMLHQLWVLASARPAAELVTTTQTLFYVKLTLEQLRRLMDAVDCLHEAQLAERDVRDWLYHEHDNDARVAEHEMEPPPPAAPAVVLLDTGILDTHSLLKSAVLSATSVLPGTSGVDRDGHGTKMAGIALHLDGVGDALAAGTSTAEHWIQSVKMKAATASGSAESATWAPTMKAAVLDAEQVDHGPRVFVSSVTAACAPLTPTDWSQVCEQLAWNDGRGRLICVSAGNADSAVVDLLARYPDGNLLESIEDPAHAWNVLTVGAYTRRTKLPPFPEYSSYKPVGTEGGISPHTSARPATADRVPVIKPEVVFEGGNVAFDGARPDATVLTTLTTSHLPHRPLGSMWATSEAVARAGHLAARIWATDATLRPATVRALIVHSASWTPAMKEQFSLNDRLRICGYGVPDEDFATSCVEERATVVIEDEMPNVVVRQVLKKKPPKRAGTSPTEPKRERQAKFFRLPVDEELLLDHSDLEVELRVTLSYLPENHTYLRRSFRGMDLKWDMQGPQETEQAFRYRINDKVRERVGKQPKTKPFPWTIGPQRRSKGTIQSDRWIGKAAQLAGSKLIAVLPINGWWDERNEFRERAQPFSLVVSVVARGLDVYTPLKSALTIEETVELDGAE